MKSVLISIQPRWCELIASGKKTVEVRKTKPKIETPFKVYIYETQGRTETPWMDEDGHEIFKGRGQVIGEFVCDKIFQYSTTQNCDGTDITDEEMTKASCLTKKEIEDYEFSAEVKDFCIYTIGVYGWHISDLVIYDKPRELSEFSKCGFGQFVPLRRPPQSWCYVESEDTE